MTPFASWMDQIVLMTRKRLLKADRRASILDAASKVFAEHGREGAKTQRIAAEAGVSEALIFRHFPSKDALYCAVLRKLIRDQDASFRSIGVMTPDARGLVWMMRAYMTNCVRGLAQPSSDSIRVLYASLAGDGHYARLTYRRAIRLSLAPLKAALEGARAAGELEGAPIDVANVVALIEHVGSNVCVARVGERPTVQYSGDDTELVQQLVMFCGRGIGLREEAIRKYLAEPPAPLAVSAKVKRSARSRRVSA